MDLNHETAMRLWNKTFGKETKVRDYTGREIVKGAYNNRNSEYGWNVDHILPQSRGGVTADHNLICCHIETNDEKADKFPCFNANEQRFEIIKVQNHYEIRSAKENDDKKIEEENSVNFYDSAAGIRLFKQLKGIQNKPKFVGEVSIKLASVKNTALIDFINEILDTEHISYSSQKTFDGHEIHISAKNYDMPLKEDISELLDKCILLNTYLGKYFLSLEYISAYELCYTVEHFEKKADMYANTEENVFGEQLSNTLIISDLVIKNTDAKKKVVTCENHEYTEYNYIFTELAKNLNKEVEGK